MCVFFMMDNILGEVWSSKTLFFIKQPSNTYVIYVLSMVHCYIESTHIEELIKGITTCFDKKENAGIFKIVVKLCIIHTK